MDEFRVELVREISPESLENEMFPPLPEETFISHEVPHPVPCETAVVDEFKVESARKISPT